MKTHRAPFLTAAILSLAALSPAGCAEKKIMTEAGLPSAQDLATDVTAPIDPIAVATAANADAPTKWSDIKEIAYDQRAQFFTGLKIVESKVDVQITELNARRGAMTSATDTKDWDFAMKEMTESRAYLQSTGEALGTATPETWAQGKDTVGQAWDRTQAAYAKVKSSTTG